MRRELLLSQQLATWPGVEVISNQIQPLIKALNETGISLSLKTLITSLISDLSSIDEATQKITEAISNNLHTLNLLDQMSGVHLFAGTSGAGKTTMIGKIALQKSKLDGLAQLVFHHEDEQLVSLQVGIHALNQDQLMFLIEKYISQLDRRLKTSRQNRQKSSRDDCLSPEHVYSCHNRREVF